MATRARSVSASSSSTESASSPVFGSAPRAASASTTSLDPMYRSTSSRPPARAASARADARVRSSAPVSPATSACSRTNASRCRGSHRSTCRGRPGTQRTPLAMNRPFGPRPVRTGSSRSVRRAQTVSHTTGSVIVDESAASTCATRAGRVDGSSSHRSTAARTTQDSSLRPIARCSIACSSFSRQARLPSDRVTANNGSYRPRRMPFSTQPRSRSNTMTSWPRRSVWSNRPSAGTSPVWDSRSKVCRAKSRSAASPTWCRSTSTANSAQRRRGGVGHVPRLDRVGDDPRQVAAEPAVSSGAASARASRARRRTGSCSLRSRSSVSTAAGRARGSRLRRAASTSWP